MSLQDRVQSDIAVAMRGGDALRRDVLRMVASAAYNVEKKQGRPLTDDEYLAVLTREVKTRRESVEAFRAGGREDLAAKEEAEIAILGEYLPAGPDRGRDRRARARGRSPRPAPSRRATWARSWAGSRHGPAAGPTASASASSSSRPSPAPTSPPTTSGRTERHPPVITAMLTRRIRDLDPLHAHATSRALAIAAGILILALTAILGADILPEPPLDASRSASWRRATSSRRARSTSTATVQTDAAREAASDAVPFQYDFTTENAIAIAAAQQLAFERAVSAGSTRRSRPTSATRANVAARDRRPGPVGRRAATTLAGLDAAGWAVGPDRGCPGPRRDAAHRAARHRGRGDADVGWPGGWPAASTRPSGCSRPSSSLRSSSRTPRSAPS